MYGRKVAFLTSVVIFVIGSLLAGLSQTMGQLIGFRAVQGIGAGGIMVGGFAIVIVAWVVLRLPRKRVEGRLDYLGAGLLAMVISALVLLTTWGGREYDWDSGVILGLAALSVIGTVAFLVVEQMVRQPVLPLNMFRNANFSLITLIGFLFGFVMMGGITFLPIFQQAVQGVSATNSGLLLSPMFLSVVLASAVAGRFISSSGRYKVLVLLGNALTAVSMLLFAQMDARTSRFASGVYLAMFGPASAC